MNRRANPILTFSLCTALVVHLLGLSAIAWWYVATTPNPKLPPLNKWTVLADIPKMAHQEHKPFPALAMAPPPQPKPKPQASPPKPKPKQSHEMPKPDLSQPPLKDDSGEENTNGTANRSTAGLQPMQALTGLEQADLMKAVADEKLLIDPLAINPAASGEINGSNDPRPVPAAAGVRQPVVVASADPLATANADPTKPSGSPTVSRGEGPTPVSKQIAPQENHPAATGSATPTANAAAAVTVNNAAPPRAVKGHLATASDTDSVAFKPEGSFEFKSGRMVARKGLKVKFSQPRLGIASNEDLRSLGETEIVLQVEVDATGKVTNADVAKSSGSTNLDEDFKIDMYGCEFAPEKDKDGHPKPSTIWTIHILI